MSAGRADGVAFRDLDAEYEPGLLDRFHRDVLATSFSSDELEDAATLARGLSGDDGPEVLVSVALDKDDAVLGGVVGEIYASERVLLLAYLAVRRDLRSTGIGTALMERVAARWYARPVVRLAVAEVHDPRRWPRLAGDDPGRRLRLYGRLGARVLGVPFIQPTVGAGRRRVPGLLLLAFYVDPDLETRWEGEVAIRSDLVGRFVRRYYELAEGVRTPYDAELARLLARIEEQPIIPLLSVHDYERVPLLP